MTELRDQITAEQLARLFHETYERLAPEYSYKTREASAVPWEQVPDNNRALMVAVTDAVLSVLSDHQDRRDQQTRRGDSPTTSKRRPRD